MVTEVSEIVTEGAAFTLMVAVLDVAFIETWSETAEQTK
jgi:hypothetical protein